MDAHRKVEPESVEIISLQEPFSIFEFIGVRFGGHNALHRCFSLARTSDCLTVVLENIPPVGILAEEVEDLAPLTSLYRLSRISFWKSGLENVETIADQDSEDLIGYVIFKEDDFKAKEPKAIHRHVFEAVFRKYAHPNNCLANPRVYELQVAGNDLVIPGILYAQQNDQTKVCAHVAMRSLLSRFVDEGDVSYREMNQIAATAVAPNPFDPRNGLGPRHIHAIFDAYGVGYKHKVYPASDSGGDSESGSVTSESSSEAPYQKYIYAGVESGAGSLLGFSMGGPEAQKHPPHIIPFFGHTFNKDAWVPDAEQAYFNIGGDFQYISSISWTSSFIGHDDNFGPNFCVPRLYVQPDRAMYAVELLKPGFESSGTEAEAVSILFFYAILRQLAGSENKWCRRLARQAQECRLVLRAVASTREEYLAHLRSVTGWRGNKENPAICDFLEQTLPEHLWVIEVSLPQLFPANQRKVGELLIHAGLPIQDSGTIDESIFIFARVPAAYYFAESIPDGAFSILPSDITSHVDVMHSH